MNYSSRRLEKPYVESLQNEANTALSPIGAELSAMTPAFDGITLFWPDHRQTGPYHATVADIATAQPLHGQRSKRFEFYRQNIAHRHVRLGGTALEQTLLEGTASWRQSLRNSDHMTFGEPVFVDEKPIAIMQSVFNPRYGRLPDEDTYVSFWRSHQKTFQEISEGFREVDSRIESIGDTLELEVPSVPNAYILSWDLINSTSLTRRAYPATNNLLVDTKDLFSEIIQKTLSHEENDTTSPRPYDYDDTGDGTHFLLWLPSYEPTDITAFGNNIVIPLAQKLRERFMERIAPHYGDLKPEIRFTIDIGSVMEDFIRYDKFTSPNFWTINGILKKTKKPFAIALSRAAKNQLYQK